MPHHTLPPASDWVSQVFERPTFRALKALLDNYEADVGVAETVTQGELREIEEFLDVGKAAAPFFCTFLPFHVPFLTYNDSPGM